MALYLPYYLVLPVYLYLLYHQLVRLVQQDPEVQVGLNHLPVPAVLVGRPNLVILLSHSDQLAQKAQRDQRLLSDPVVQLDPEDPGDLRLP